MLPALLAVPALALIGWGAVEAPWWGRVVAGMLLLGVAALVQWAADDAPAASSS